MTTGHNEHAVRLAALAGDAQVALDRVASGEADAVEGWLAYGAALNEGRSLFPGDTEFGQWIAANSLRQLAGAVVEDHEQAAAMWAAANADQLAEARAMSKARTVRGWHTRWKEIEAERETEAKRAEARKAAEEARAEADAAATKAAEARAAVEAAPNPEARAQAEAVVAKVVAEQQVVEAKAAEAAVEAAEPHDPLRREAAKLTREAIEDEWCAMRAEVPELRKRIADQRDQIATLKMTIKTFEEASDLGRQLGMALRENDKIAGRMKEHQSNAARLQRQVNAQAAEIKRLKQAREDGVITL